MDIEYETTFNSESKKLAVKCKVCSIHCDTLDQFFVHQKSKNHIKKSEKLKLFNAYQSVKVQETDNVVSVPVKSLSSLASPTSSESSYSISSGSCYTPFSCKICNKDCNTKEQLDIHYSGKAHIKKSLRYEYKDWDTAKIPESLSLPSTYNECSAVEEMTQTNVERTQSPKIQEGNQSSSPGNKSPAVESLACDLNNLLIPERSLNSIKCVLCNQFMNTDEQYSMHCNGTKHKKKMKSMNIDEENNFLNLQIGDNELKFCDSCEIRIHSNNMQSHLEGKSHKEKMIKKTQTMDVLDDHCTVQKVDLSPDSVLISSLKLTPRNYQTEVYEKGLKNDCVIFLPTGTGKTLVASMVIVKMLEQNPNHRVAFLVDKVLLVMQQLDFFKDQFENICCHRFDCKGSTELRKFRLLGLANCYVNTDHSFSVRDHDVVVATAELFRGLLSNNKLFWEEFSLVIFDEAHHCVKDHPYNKLLQEYHLYPKSVLIDKVDINVQLQSGPPNVDEEKLVEWKRRRCKIIGLTASPAGDIDKETTYKMLLELLKSLGDVKIVTVTANKEELEQYTSNSEIETKLVKYTDNESNLREIMKSTFFFMIGKFERFIKLSKNLVQMKENRALNVEDVFDFKSQLQHCLEETQSVQRTAINHVLKIINIIDAVDTFGYKSALSHLKELINNDNEKVWFNNNIFTFVSQSEKIIENQCEEHSSVVQAIIEEAKNLSGESRTILVLVRERQTARELEAILKVECSDQHLILLVGHGAGGSKTQKSNKGMNVAKQKKALTMIKERKNQIIVATSVADEGIDLPDCDLVILINPPNSVQALVQVRGRARKKSSRLLMICREEESINELHLLQFKEKNIIECIEQILSHDCE